MASTTTQASLPSLPPSPPDGPPPNGSPPDGPPPSSSTSPDHDPSSNSSSLYLVTFLATLFLLLFVSCAIVLRSYIVRRRMRRRIDAANALGIVLAPRAQGSKRRRFGAKPKMFEAWISEGGCKWNEMMPLMAQPLLVKRRYKDKPAPTSPDPQAPANECTTPIPVTTTPAVPSASSRTTSIIRSLLRRPTPPEQPPIPQPQKPSYRIRPEMLQIAVLVAMPSRSDESMEKISIVDAYDEEEELPELVMGIARIPYRLPKTTPS